MYSTDYPHWHADDEGDGALPIQLSPERTRKIMSENARAWYRLNERPGVELQTEASLAGRNKE